MKEIILIIALLFIFNSYSQEENIIKNDSIYVSGFNCNEGKIEATKNFNEKKYYIYSYGLKFIPDIDWNNYYKNYMIEKYNIYLKDGGCVISEFSNCYSEKMRAMVLEKFGADIFEKSKKEAQKEFNNE